MSLQVMMMMTTKMMMMMKKEKTKVFELYKQCFHLLRYLGTKIIILLKTGWNNIEISAEQDSVIHQTSCFVFLADEQKMEIIDHTETNLVALRRTIYLTIQSRYSEHSFTIAITNWIPGTLCSCNTVKKVSFKHCFSLSFLNLWLIFFHSCSLDFEECAHKLLKMQIKPEQMVSH